MSNDDTADILERLATVIVRWKEFYPRGHIVRVRADIVTQSHNEIERLRAALAERDIAKNAILDDAPMMAIPNTSRYRYVPGTPLPPVTWTEPK